MKAIITGKEGMIAKRLIHRLSGKFEVVATASRGTDQHALDLAEPEKFDYSQVGMGDFVIHLASISSPDRCEKEYGLAYAVNVEGTVHFVKKCLERGACVLFMSSDAVYGPSQEGKPPFDENSEPAPAGKYGEMKLEVEHEFASHPNFKAFRLSYVLSKSDKFLKYLSECSLKKEPARVYHPFCRNAVCIEDVLDAVENIMGKWQETASPFINVCGDALISRKEIAEAYTEVADPSLRIEIEPAPPGFFGPRPRIINVTSLYLYGLLGRKPARMQDALRAEFQKEEAV